MQFQLTRALEILERTPRIFRALLGGLRRKVDGTE